MAALPAPIPLFGLRQVSDADFRAFQKLIYEEAGIHLGPSKKALLAGRLSRRLRELGLESLGQYHAYVREHREETVQLLDRITTNETRFFREPGQFTFVAERLVPRWVASAAAGERPRRIRAWSAACSTGEEPYSLAMLLLDHLRPEAGWEVEIVASDISTKALARASAGVYPETRIAEVPLTLRDRYMLKGVRSQAGLVKVGPEARAAVRFERLNLMSDAYPSGSFDLVLCRNVLIYFDAVSRAHVVARLLDRLVPGGHLFLGHAESLARHQALRGACPNVYERVARGWRDLGALSTCSWSTTRPW